MQLSWIGCYTGVDVGGLISYPPPPPPPPPKKRRVVKAFFALVPKLPSLGTSAFAFERGLCGIKTPILLLCPHPP